MKTLLIGLLICSCAFLVYSKENNQSTKSKPKATYQVGSAKITVWENTNSKGETWKNFTVEKVYKKEGKWESTSSFNTSELLELQVALEKAISEQVVKQK